jgi:hypothetical protein
MEQQDLRDNKEILELMEQQDLRDSKELME